MQTWVKMTGKQDENVALMNQLVFQLDQMSTKPELIPGMYLTFRDTLSTFANMLLDAKQQPLLLDYVFIAEQGTALPKAEVSVLESLKYGLLKFFSSFINDYNDLSDETGDTRNQTPITVWIGNGISGGRDQALVLSQLILQDFTANTDIPVNLQLIPASTILTATVAGKGPDVALQLSGSDPANYAMRGAVEDLSKLENFDEIKTRFPESAFVPYQYQNGVYALPETFSFPMMFYRKDILEELGIDIESIQSWQDLIEVLPIIQRKNMNVGIPATFNSYVTFLYQMNGELYRDNGAVSNLDTKTSLDAFHYFMRFFTDYNLPISYNFVTRFRTGEMPIGIDDYTTYNLLQISAPEISGEWGMTPIPGQVRADGSVNNVAPTSGAGCVLMSASKNKENGWKLMQWLTESENPV